ncbi:MAG: hypothetical protein ACYST9_00030 [Planctomycetota bacterium]|jgi:hypothetical protein
MQRKRFRIAYFVKRIALVVADVVGGESKGGLNIEHRTRNIEYRSGFLPSQE